MQSFHTLPIIDSHIELRDGRTLSYAEYGDPNGKPILAFHGLPGSRLSWGLLPDCPIDSGVRLIGLDRPGYGGSAPNPGRTLQSWAEDVRAFVDQKELESFCVLGVSGGGPGALACAAMMPERLKMVGVVSGAAPTNAPGVMVGLSRVNRFFFKLAWYLPGLSTFNISLVARVVRRFPNKYIDSMKRKLHQADLQVLDRQGVREMLIEDFSEALQQGAQGMIDDMRANHGEPWGFELDSISCHTKIWACEFDRSVSPAMGRYLAENIPGSELVEVRNAGHLWVLTHLKEVTNELAQN